MRYFGYETFEDYYQATSRRGYCNENRTREQAWQSIHRKLESGVHLRAAKWIQEEIQKNPKYRTKPVWYFVMPEARATIPAELLQVVDACGAGIS